MQNITSQEHTPAIVEANRGASLRISKGIYYRLGDFQGTPTVTITTALVDKGVLGITNRHIYFFGDLKSFRLSSD